jgi:hypothetical protein
MGAITGGSPSHHSARNTGLFARKAHFASPAIHPVLGLKPTLFAINVYILSVIERAAACFNSRIQHMNNGFV